MAVLSKLRFSLARLLVIVTAIAIAAGLIQYRRIQIAKEIDALKEQGVTFTSPRGFFGVPLSAGIVIRPNQKLDDELIGRVRSLGIPSVHMQEHSSDGRAIFRNITFTADGKEKVQESVKVVPRQ